MAKSPSKNTSKKVEEQTAPDVSDLDQMIEESKEQSEAIYEKLLNNPTLKELGELMVFNLQYIESQTETSMQMQALTYTLIDLLIEKGVFTQDEFNTNWEKRFKEVYKAFAEAVSSADKEAQDVENQPQENTKG